jgi:hypothetical protein
MYDVVESMMTRICILFGKKLDSGEICALAQVSCVAVVLFGMET